MTPEQLEAIAAVRETLTELPHEPSPDLAASWWAHVRTLLHKVAQAFPEGGAS